MRAPNESMQYKTPNKHRFSEAKAKRFFNAFVMIGAPYESVLSKTPNMHCFLEARKNPFFHVALIVFDHKRIIGF